MIRWINTGMINYSILEWSKAPAKVFRNGTDSQNDICRKGFLCAGRLSGPLQVFSSCCQLCQAAITALRDTQVLLFKYCELSFSNFFFLDIYQHFKVYVHVTCIIHHCCFSWLISGKASWVSERLETPSARSLRAVCTYKASFLTRWMLSSLFTWSCARVSLILLSSALLWFWRLLTCWVRLIWASAVKLTVMESLRVTSWKRSFSVPVTSCSKT